MRKYAGNTGLLIQSLLGYKSRASFRNMDGVRQNNTWVKFVKGLCATVHPVGGSGGICYRTAYISCLQVACVNSRMLTHFQEVLGLWNATSKHNPLCMVSVEHVYMYCQKEINSLLFSFTATTCWHLGSVWSCFLWHTFVQVRKVLNCVYHVWHCVAVHPSLPMKWPSNSPSYLFHTLYNSNWNFCIFASIPHLFILIWLDLIIVIIFVYGELLKSPKNCCNDYQ